SPVEAANRAPAGKRGHSGLKADGPRRQAAAQAPGARPPRVGDSSPLLSDGPVRCASYGQTVAFCFIAAMMISAACGIDRRDVLTIRSYSSTSSDVTPK